MARKEYSLLDITDDGFVSPPAVRKIWNPIILQGSQMFGIAAVKQKAGDPHHERRIPHSNGIGSLPRLKSVGRAP